MKLDDFLKPKQVRFTANDNRSDLTNGKVYDVIGATYGRLKIHNDNGGNAWYDMSHFELVIESVKCEIKFKQEVKALPMPAIKMDKRVRRKP